MKEIWEKYKGAIIGVIIAIVILATRLYDLIVGILLILAGAFIGNYVQQNKDDVKTKLKKFIIISPFFRFGKSMSRCDPVSGRFGFRKTGGWNIMDNIDKKILSLLVQNARIPVKEIASEVMLTAPAVSVR